MFLGSLGLLLGVLVMVSGVVTFSRGLPEGVELRAGQRDPLGSPLYLLSQESLGGGVALLALNVVLRRGDRPYLFPAIVLLVITLAARWFGSHNGAAR